MVSTFLVGLTMGICGKYIIYGNESSRFAAPILVGIIGSFLAHVVGGSTGLYKSDDPVGFVATILAATILLTIYGLFFGRYRKFVH